MVFAYPIIDTVSIIKQDGSVDFSLSVTAASGVAYNIEDNTLAISSSRGNEITMIDLTKQKVTKTFSPGGKTIGIVATNNKLVYHIYKKAIQVMDLTDESTRDITTENIDTAINITISGHKLYYTSYYYHTVVCCDFDGTKQWSFKDVNLLRNPYGISADNDGNVYVLGNGTKNVVVFSHDGQTKKELLSSNDGLNSAYAINFERATNHLLVATDNYKAYLYKVTGN
ncbi:unnamed protein product [Mytilus edulis]|uniref:Uncharacterized protein n=2 Tax=Mytilus edulis TaxID=6550 RepID=A0A8S3RZM6_MYTED|nr:unnamed protein product [Mytilus edulis]